MTAMTNIISRQAPLPSGYDRHTTAIEVLAGRSLRGSVAIVTGAYPGLGLETVRALAPARDTV